ncbi:hypothetical protein [Streptomyces sp. A012304]|uniref:hypothetical protein n=1 Tax=Streptomyces sp. A012304 TaxID=375446 RepID=UPI00222F04F9|nr:hypothetical protein [Streptomyces sp. A012304]GKQ37432.1 hypothetical protein ALMP_39690 [Streptomyces sp. A012304]
MSLTVGALAVGLWTLGWTAIVLAWRFGYAQGGPPVEPAARPARVAQPTSEASGRYGPL